MPFTAAMRGVDGAGDPPRELHRRRADMSGRGRGEFLSKRARRF